ncbi:FAD/NAD(P)-binding domain-containing protein [Amniculicola lignicola CBS 123094]|uniref:FAD/NAD(P)-binding domain-containing protein n=1 Tax=Amniculicola lignicola CBS 123094 TaxID=1392246 RepID=A0A6A5W987_9PLEO|nr:FAD/NAD(P)-binding domain-containing protein [Amniculicola lignicola CBS 123094]
MSGLKILVVGSSIAGPTTAYWLAKAGAHVTIIERFPHLRTGGQAIDIRTSGVAVMRKMPGMEDLVRAKREKIEGISFVRPDGRPWGVITSTGDPDEQSLISEFEISRGNLAGVLVGLTEGNERIEYVYGEQVAAIKQQGGVDVGERAKGPVTVEFMNGLEPREFDLIVACDGATSRTRATGLECGVRDHVHSTNIWAAYFSVPRSLLNDSTIGQAHSAPGGRFISVGSNPSTQTSTIMLMAHHPPSHRDATLPFRQALAQGESALKKYITESYADVGWRTEEFLAYMNTEATDFYASEILQVKPPSLYNLATRVVLVGDAGYATGPTGFGTSIALTGAYHLAGELGKHAGDLEAGLVAYEDRMRPLIKEMQKIPPLVGTIMAPQTAWGIWMRNHLFALVAWSGVVGVVQRFFGAAFRSSEGFVLPEYEWVR